MDNSSWYFFFQSTNQNDSGWFTCSDFYINNSDTLVNSTCLGFNGGFNNPSLFEFGARGGTSPTRTYYQSGAVWNKTLNTSEKVCVINNLLDGNLTSTFTCGSDAQDDIFPTLQISFNLTTILQGNVINFSANATDDIGLIYINLTNNQSGVIVYSNYTASTTSYNVTNVTIITASAGSVINFTAYATDSINQVTQLSQLFTVSSADTCSPTSPLAADYNYICSDNCIGENINANGFDVMIIGDSGYWQGIISGAGSTVNWDCPSVDLKTQ